ncbi:phage tail tape measure protein [Stenotrophomonas acidaminiphila]|uniref:phage tail tape measure protein n=1 Tax=Stenotrophomonas acidaminiphila TaxID=128780 RepID=UPI0028AC8B17|nr:phage tail tape measure protein [Stenotrophomonas acidaminiphila]
MNDTAIGTARIDVTVDTSQFDSAVSAAKRAVSDMSTSAQQQYQQLAGAEKRRIETLARQADTIGMTKAQQLAYNIALRTSGDIQDELLKKLAAREAATKRAGISEAQYAAALRGTPAQLTDIFVSLQGGQRPMTILLQQGGQLKDMFGGLVPAAQALGGQLAAMINPATIAAGALGALAYAGYTVAEQQAEFDRILIRTGASTAALTGDFQELIANLDALEGVSRGGAADAIMAVANSGRFAGEQFDIVTRASARMQSSMGDGVDKTVAKFEEIAKSPVAALLKLNETEHFLTDTQLRRVAALEDEGRAQDAAAEGVRIYGEHLDDVATKADATLSSLSRWWRDVKDDTTQAWGEVGVYMQLLDRVIEKQKQSSSISFGDQLRTVGRMSGNVASLVPDGWISSGATLANALGKKWLTERAGEAVTPSFGVTSTWDNVVDSKAEAKAREERKKAQEEWDRWVGQNLSKREKQQAEEKRIQEAGKKLGLDQAKIDEQIAASRKRFAEAESKGRKSTDPTVALAQRIKQQIALNTEQLQAEAKLTTSQRLRIQVEQELLDLGAKAAPERRAEINQLLKQLDATGELVDAKEKEARATEQLQRLQAQIRVSEENRLRANTIDLLTYGRGGDAVEMLRRQLDIQREYEEGLKQIRDRGVAADSEEWRRQEQALRESRERMLDAEREFQQRRLALMGDWRVGANAALEDYLAATADVASQSRDLFANAFQGAEDAIVRFVKTGKLSFSELADSIIADLARIAARQMITGVLGNAMAGLFGGTTAAGNAVVSGGTQSITAGLMGQLIPNAKGGAYNSPSLSAYSGEVYDSPHLFAFAKGAGVFGEAGPEAIMPLRRGPDGRLGVSAAGGGAPSVKVEVINKGQPVKATASAEQQPDGSQLIRLILDTVADDVASGGRVAQAGKSRYGWRDQLG